MLEKIEYNQPYIETGTSGNQSKAPKAKTDTDVTINVNYAGLIQKVLQCSKSDVKSIEKARKDLLSGKLDSPENILKAAKNIFKYGI